MRWLLALLVFTQPLHATVLVQGADTSRVDYRAALKANPELKSPSQAHLAAHPTGPRRDAVLETLALAQKAFLSNSRQEAADLFASLTDLLPEDDWSATERGVFVMAYLRRAQLENDPATQRELLAQSLAVGGDLPDTSLFPPPLLKARAQLESEIPKIEIPARWFGDGWTVVLINGKPCRQDACAPIPRVSTPVRVTLLSEQWVPVTAIVKAGEISDIRPKRVAWYEGACGKERFHPAAQSLGERRTLCESPGRALNLNPVARAGGEVPRMEIREKGDPFYSNPWFWTGVGVVVAAVVISSARDRDGKEPTTTYGLR